MIDGIALNTTIDTGKLVAINNLGITAKRSCNNYGCEISWKIAGLIVKAWLPKEAMHLAHLKINGSIHRLAKSGNVNGGSISYGELLASVTTLIKLLDTDGTLIRIGSIEIGYNLTTSRPVGEFLEHLVAHREKPFTTAYNGSMLRLDRSHYALKLYDKGKQLKQVYGIPDRSLGHSLRVEMKIQASELKRLGTELVSIADLENPILLGNLANLLANRIEEVVWYSQTEYNNVHTPNTDRNLWEGYTKKQRKSIKSRRARLEKNNTLFNYKSEVIGLLKAERIKFENSSYAKGSKRVHFEEINPLDYLEEGYTHSIINESSMLYIINELKKNNNTNYSYKIKLPIFNTASVEDMAAFQNHFD